MPNLNNCIASEELQDLHLIINKIVIYAYFYLISVNLEDLHAFSIRIIFLKISSLHSIPININTIVKLNLRFLKFINISAKIHIVRHIQELLYQNKSVIDWKLLINFKTIYCKTICIQSILNICKCHSSCCIVDFLHYCFYDIKLKTHKWFDISNNVNH